MRKTTCWILWILWFAGAMSLVPAFNFTGAGIVGLAACMISLCAIPRPQLDSVNGAGGIFPFRFRVGVLLSLLMSLAAISMGVLGVHIQSTRMTQASIERANIWTAMNAIDSIPITIRTTKFSVYNTDSVWIVSPVGKDSMVLVGAYVDRGEIIQDMSTDIIHAIDLFCKRTSKGYTEYKSCRELVTTKTTTAKSLSRTGIPKAVTVNAAGAWWRGELWDRICSIGDDSLSRMKRAGPGGFTTMAVLRSDTIWSTDSTTASVVEYVAFLHIEYDGHTKQWKPSLSPTEIVGMQF